MKKVFLVLSFLLLSVMLVGATEVNARPSSLMALADAGGGGGGSTPPPPTDTCGSSYYNTQDLELLEHVSCGTEGSSSSDYDYFEFEATFTGTMIVNFTFNESIDGSTIIFRDNNRQEIPYEFEYEMFYGLEIQYYYIYVEAGNTYYIVREGSILGIDYTVKIAKSYKDPIELYKNNDFGGAIWVNDSIPGYNNLYYEGFNFYQNLTATYVTTLHTSTDLSLPYYYNYDEDFIGEEVLSREIYLWDDDLREELSEYNEFLHLIYIKFLAANNKADFLDKLNVEVISQTILTVTIKATLGAEAVAVYTIAKTAYDIISPFLGVETVAQQIERAYADGFINGSLLGFFRDVLEESGTRPVLVLREYAELVVNTKQTCYNYSNEAQNCYIEYIVGLKTRIEVEIEYFDRYEYTDENMYSMILNKGTLYNGYLIGIKDVSRINITIDKMKYEAH